MAIFCLILILCSEFIIQNGLNANVIQTNKLNFEELEEELNNIGLEELQTKQEKEVMNEATADFPTLMSTISECDCGRYSKDCTLGWYRNYCNCLNGYADRNGTCTKCDCGKYSKGCKFNSTTYKKECICKEDYYEKFGTCAECDCGRYSRGCKFDLTIKKCECRDGYSPDRGTCKECDCGSHSKSCKFGWIGKICECEKGYQNKNGTCTECDCGENSFRCSFLLNGTKWCSCPPSYAQNNGTCSAICMVPTDCSNGTVCTKGEGGKHFCECPPNFKGEMCEISVLCEEIERMCRAMDAVCVLKNSQAYCQCPPGKKVDLQSGLCTDICYPGKCVHGTCEVVELDYSCKCDEGYTGLHCDKVIKPKPNNSVLWTVALLSVNTLICVMLFAIFCLLCCRRK
ncbi:eat-20 [Trichonephila clavata]|uniref:Eat-20 n=1 Tax=Trichonephila clavata TaxID=2740835 RepID=A0A8X6F4Z2_TRICU|nr:eat-20 [Trichonephila clavata]